MQISTKKYSWQPEYDEPSDIAPEVISRCSGYDNENRGAVESCYHELVSTQKLLGRLIEALTESGRLSESDLSRILECNVRLTK